jgi:predicted nucleic acid-binding protein
MTALVLDAGALIAIDRDDRALVAKLRVAQRDGLALRSNGAVITEAWREQGGRQARLAQLLKAVDVVPVDEAAGRRAGELLGRSATTDPVDATVVAVAATGDRILTSDPSDIRKLVTAARRAIHIVPC